MICGNTISFQLDLLTQALIRSNNNFELSSYVIQQIEIAEKNSENKNQLFISLYTFDHLSITAEYYIITPRIHTPFFLYCSLMT